MPPDALRSFRERRGDSQTGFAHWLNGRLGRKYDNATISRWESGAERIPAKVAEFIQAATAADHAYLLGEPAEGASPGALRDTVPLRLTDVVPNPDQPRRHFDEAELQQLAQSMRQVGQLSPILVKRHPGEPGRCLLVAGERRWRAAGLAGLDTVAAHILDDDSDSDQIALIENLQRVNLSPVEEAEGIQRLVNRHGYAQEQAGALLGRSRTEINTTLSLLRLHPSIRKACVTSHTDLPKALLLELARMDMPLQRTYWEQARTGALTARAARAVRMTAEVGGRLPRLPSPRPAADPDEAPSPTPERVLATLPRLQQGLESGLAALEAGRPRLSRAEADRLRALRRRLDACAAAIDRILGEQG